jgi:hypothetical protein
MLTGKQFTIIKATVALEATNGTRSLLAVQEGAVITVTSGPTVLGTGTVGVLWEGRTLAMFAVDIEKRGIEVAELTAQSAHT